MLFAFAFGLVQWAPKRQSVKGSNPFRSSKPLVIAHRGSRLLYPENTLFAFKSAVNLGVDMLEMDVRLTRDGKLTVHHDSTIDRTSDGTGRVIDYRYDELKAFNFGANFVNLDGKPAYEDQKFNTPNLESVFQTFPDIPMIINIKDKGLIGELAIDQMDRLLKKYNRYEKTIVASFNYGNIRYMKDRYFKMHTSTSEKWVRRYVILHTFYLDWFFYTTSCSLQLPVEQAGFILSTSHFINSIHKRNMAVQYWTINDPLEMSRLINLNVDGIITDRPDLLLKIMESPETQ